MHPLAITEPSELVIVGVPQLSVAVALPGPGTPEGLHPKSEPGGHEVNTGAIVSVVQVKCWAQVDELPHASVAV